ncbi:hypothetical protein TorRG33x02_013790 [Trema orientale]|uniref:Uncharacterized protein n=1 Tax=Trema orientale TaxID=63057 RepID=A0A2P5FXA0_TREOI|nr:hypothetical protein TorRG33x02_013790 [Trema orientale]
MLHEILSMGIFLSSKGFYSPIDNATSRNLPLHLNYTIMQRMSSSHLIAELDRIFIGRLKMPNQSVLPSPQTQRNTINDINVYGRKNMLQESFIPSTIKNKIIYLPNF